MKRILLSLLSAFCITAAQAQVSLVQNMNPASAANPHEFTVFNGKLYFIANGNDSTGGELYQYDGTGMPTLVADLNPSVFQYGLKQSSFTNIHFPVLNGKMFMEADDDVTGFELYSYNGSGAPTLVADLETQDLSGSGPAVSS